MNKEATIVLIVSIILLLITFLTNATPILDFWEEPIIGDGLGPLCDNEQDCRAYCQNNRGNCEHYCEFNPQNKLCDVLSLPSKR